VLVGINLLREGLDLPEVSLVAVLDADKEGFLRSDTSLIQTSGRAARNLGGRVILYADKMTGSMSRAIAEMARRRDLQVKYNEKHGITPSGIVKSVDEIMRATAVADAKAEVDSDIEMLELSPGLDRDQMIAILEEQMMNSAARLEFEKAASLRDRIDELRMTGAMDGRGKGEAGVAPRRRGGKRGGRRGSDGVLYGKNKRGRK
jgi:excinuclease ABC subunit B